MPFARPRPAERTSCSNTTGYRDTTGNCAAEVEKTFAEGMPPFAKLAIVRLARCNAAATRHGRGRPESSTRKPCATKRSSAISKHHFSIPEIWRPSSSVEHSKSGSAIRLQPPRRRERPVSEVHIPGGLLARIFLVPPQPPLMHRHGQSVCLALCERLWSRAQISPPDLNVGERFGRSTFGFGGVAGFWTRFSSPLPKS